MSQSTPMTNILSLALKILKMGNNFMLAAFSKFYKISREIEINKSIAKTPIFFIVFEVLLLWHPNIL